MLLTTKLAKLYDYQVNNYQNHQSAELHDLIYLYKDLFAQFIRLICLYRYFIVVCILFLISTFQLLICVLGIVTNNG